MKERKHSKFQNLTSGIPIEGSVDGEVIENDVKSTSLVQKTSESIIEARVLMSQLIRGDDESKNFYWNILERELKKSTYKPLSERIKLGLII